MGIFGMMRNLIGSLKEYSRHSSNAKSHIRHLVSRHSHYSSNAKFSIAIMRRMLYACAQLERRKL